MRYIVYRRLRLEEEEMSGVLLEDMSKDSLKAYYKRKYGEDIEEEKFDITEEKAERIAEAAQFLFNSFTWVRTKEGPTYWNEVYCKLTDLARTRKYR